MNRLDNHMRQGGAIPGSDASCQADGALESEVDGKMGSALELVAITAGAQVVQSCFDIVGR